MRTLIYQIFVDRFAGDGGVVLAPLPAGIDPWKHHAGGTLDGITARLDHLERLGVDAIYLTPIFHADSNHKYDTRSFDEVDPRFGGDAAFARLAAACRDRKMGLILDGVLNHVGEKHAWFEAALRDSNSPYASWFKFTKHPHDYARWRGFGFLPELNLDSPEVRAAIFEGEDAVLRRWLRRGATGWRLDCANDLGFAACGLAARVGREEDAPDGMIGEVMTYAEAWVSEGRLDGVMNYWFRESVLGAATGRVQGVQAAYNLEHQAARFRHEALLRSWNVLSTHDTPRLASVVEDEAARTFAITLAFVSPGVPLLYYGEEMGMKGGADPDNRAPMSWSASLEYADTIGSLARLRKTHAALTRGRYVAMPQPGTPSLIVFARVCDDDPSGVVLVVANACASPSDVRAFLPHAWFFDSLPMRDLWGRREVSTIRAGRIDLSLAPFEVALLAPDDSSIPGYRFFRP